MDSNLSDKIMDTNKFIENVKKKAHNLLLFLSNVKNITIYQRIGTNEIKILEISSNNKFDFKNFIKNSYNYKKLANSFDPVHIETSTKIKDKKNTVKWLLFGSTKNIGEFEPKLGFLFIACSVNNSESEHRGKLFHFLPLNDVDSGLPIHLNANFRINSSR